MCMLQNPEPSHAHAAEVVFGSNNTADQETSQSATSSITNENFAGRRLLGGEQKGSCKHPLLLISACLQFSVTASEHGLVACSVTETRAFRLDVVQYCLAFSSRNVLYKHKLYPLLADWDDWQKFTLQYLDSNNNIASTQVAVPSEFGHAAHAVPLLVVAHLKEH